MSLCYCVSIQQNRSVVQTEMCALHKWVNILTISEAFTSKKRRKGRVYGCRPSQWQLHILRAYFSLGQRVLFERESVTGGCCHSKEVTSC